jgi:alanyl-tRNA synthetase
MTLKLYWNDSHIKRFNARVEDIRLEDGDSFVMLDRTAFYPTGGGQPCDRGLIRSVPVVDIQIDDGDRIYHRLHGNIALAIGEDVECEVDWFHRRAMMQQHTGQHILSQAFFQLFGAETRGFRITDSLAEIDLTLEARPDEIESAIIRAEDLANGIVFEDREIRIHEVTPHEAAQLPLRKESFVTGCIRVIEIVDYDWSPCGGTHAKRTGEVGMIVVRGWERAKKMTRVRFLCGARALSDYRLANRTAEAIAQKLSVGRDEVTASVERLLDERKQSTRRIRELGELSAKAEAQDLLEGTESTDAHRVVSRIFDGRDFEEIKIIAHRLVEQNGIIALLAIREVDMARLVFARSVDVSADMNSLIKAACEKLGGRGGGKPEFAQGGGPKVDDLEKTIGMVRELIVES